MWINAESESVCACVCVCVKERRGRGIKRKAIQKSVERTRDKKCFVKKIEVKIVSVMTTYHLKAAVCFVL